MADETMGNHMRSARAFKGVTRDEAAARFGVTTQTMYNYEKGKTFPPSNVLKAMALFYDCTSDYLLGLTDDFHTHL